ncbi:MAG: tRNA (adenosine(37)-N6)-threonylcarbamoyltransferase complex dimerization subunit type 1 TsaB [Kiloniellaceae bacterium]
MTAASRNDGTPVLLAMDAAGSACSVALWAGGRVVLRRFAPMARGHSEQLVPMIAAVMAEWGGGFADLTALAVTTGPGAFTGVRIGLATARGLALARGLPLIGVSSLEVAAAAATADERAGRLVLSVIDSKRGALFHQVFDGDLGERGPPAEIAPQDLAAALPPGPLVICGDGAETARAALQAAGRSDAAVAAAAGPADAAILAARAALRDPADRVPVQPVYLRQPDVTPPKAAAKPVPRG